MSFGARVLKTGIAVTLALYLSSLFLNPQSPVPAAIAAIFAMQPSIYRSWKYFLDQLQTTTLGAIVALLGGMVLSNEPIAVGLIIVLVIMICLKLNMGETVGLTLVTVVSIMEASGDWHFALNRFLLTLVGIVSAFLINITVFPPKPKVQFVKQIQSVFSGMSLLLRTSISDEIKEVVFREEKNNLGGSIKSLSDKYNLFEEEQKKMKRSKFSETRQMVVYKQMLLSLQKGYEVLDSVERHYFQAPRTPAMDLFFDSHLELVIKFHEHALLKFEDKLKPNGEEAAQFVLDNDRFMEQAITEFDIDKDGMLRLSIVAAAIYDYGYQLERLNRLAEHVHSSSEDKESQDKILNWLKWP